MTTRRTPAPAVDYLADGTPVNHDPYSCDCHETCALCAGVYRIRSLRPSGEWEMVCPDCRRDGQTDLHPHHNN